MANFESEYFRKRIQNDPRHTAKRLEPNIEVFKKFIMSLPPNSKVLDLGCGNGDKIMFVKNFRSDIDIYAIDIGDVKDLLPKGVNFVRGDITNVENYYAKSFFDAVFCFHVLEHILYPSDLIEKVKRLIKDGGRVYFEVPYWTTAAFAFLSPISFWGDPTHLNIWTKLKGYRTLTMNGFKDVKVRTSSCHNLLPNNIKNVFYYIFDNKYKTDNNVETNYTNVKSNYTNVETNYANVDNSFKDLSFATLENINKQEVIMGYKKSNKLLSLLKRVFVFPFFRSVLIVYGNK